ncbi:MAG: hypothetical protein H8D87_19465 [Deltaproteobacteria bacterium]|nr:hypothetical protein [Candidatus Desulfobacula maris]
MKKQTFFLIIIVLLIVSPSGSFSKESVHVDVLYMDHGPMQPTLRQLRALFLDYKDKLTVSWYDFESEEGIDFKAKMGINQHIPMIIWVNGKSELFVQDHKGKDRKIKFTGFPTGSGPSFFQGKWKVEDLADLLDQRIK